ncbi:unnamed protein product [Anisakis simplex]|uniref:Uncharacterized protein n=1 Tax=Anisakis simplex TaxID=6269 RepID=A0A0M3J2I0_ANISI|nr:unnamed protein product [Anisakis simplex]
MTQSRKSYIKRSTAERTLRFLFRRRPCMIVALLEVLLMGILIVVLMWMMIIYDNDTRKIALLEKVVAMSKSDEVDEFGKKSDFWRCQYDVSKDRNTSAYNFELCKISSERSPQKFAFINEWPNDSSCTGRMKSVPCQTYRSSEMLRADELAPYQELPRSCMGVNGIAMPYALVNVNRGRLVRRISLKNLIKFKGRIALSSDLFMRCPNCRVNSQYHRIKRKETRQVTKEVIVDTRTRVNETRNQTVEYCARLLRTFVKGWPDLVMSCDMQEESEIDIDRKVYCPYKK